MILYCNMLKLIINKKDIIQTCFGRLLFDVIGCEEIFKILPIDGIPTYNEFNEYDIETDEFHYI